MQKLVSRRVRNNMVDVIITYDETLDFLAKEWLETRDFVLVPNMRQWTSHLQYMDERIKAQLNTLKKLIEQSNKDIVKIEKCIMIIHNQLGKLYEIRIDNLEETE